VTSPPKVPRRRLRRGCLGLLALLGVLGLLLILLHRPLLHLALQRGGPALAATAGLDLNWQVHGNLWNDLSLRELSVRGTPWLTQAESAEIHAEYDWRALWRGDFPALLHKLRVRGLRVVADLRQLPPSPAKKTTAGGPPPALWPRELDLDDLDLDLTLADGSRLLVRGLSLRAGAGRPGRFTCRLLQREPGGVKLENLQAVLRWEPLQVAFEQLALPGGLVVETLSADASRLWQPEAELRVQARAARGAAGIHLEAALRGLFTPPQHLLAELRVRGLDAAALAGLGLPEAVQFRDAEAEIRFSGDPAAPPALAVTAQLSANELQVAGLRADRVAASLEVADGRARLTEGVISRNGDQVRLEGEAELPAQVSDAPQTRWQASLRAELPEPAAWLVQAPPLQGRIDLQARAKGVGAVPTEVEGSLRGGQLAFEGRRLPEIDSRFRLDGRQATLEIPELRLGGANRVSLAATLQLQERQPVELTLSAELPEAEAWMASLGLNFPAERARAVVRAEGRAALALADLQEGGLDRLQAELKVDVTDTAWDGMALGPLRLQVRASDGQLRLESLRLEADEHNRLAATAELALRAPHAFRAEADADLGELRLFNALSNGLGVPEILAGRADGKLTASGQLQPWSGTGSATFRLAELRLAGRPETLRLDLQTEFADRRLRLLALEAGAGAWRLTARGALDEEQARLEELQLWQDQRLLLAGHVRAPLAWDRAEAPPLEVELRGQGLPLDEVLAATGVSGLPRGVFDLELRLQGRSTDPTGSLQVRGSGIVVPQAPKSLAPASLAVDSRWQGGRLENRLELIQPPLQPLTLTAALPLEAAALKQPAETFLQLPVEAQLRLPTSDLGFLRELAPELVRALPLRGRIEASLSGSLAEPLLRAAVDLDAAEILWQQPDLPSARDLRLRLRGRGRQLTLEDASLLLAGGQVRLTGSLDADDLRQPRLDLRLRADEALVYRDAGASLRANADLVASGTPERGRLSGEIGLVRGRVFREIDLLPLLKLPADVPAVPPDTRRREAKLELPAVVHPWAFDVRVRTRDPVLLSGNLANGAVSADVRLAGTGASPQLSGGANIDRLQLQLPFSVVRMTHGAITLRPERPFDPDLDLRGESRIGSHDVSLFVYGASTAPKTRFTSSPPLSEPDIATLLATGTLLGGSAAELASEAASRAAFLFASELTRKLFNRKKVVREEPPRLQLSFTPSGADRSQDSMQAAYDLSRHWRLTSRFTQSGRMKAALGYLLRFGERVQALGETPAGP
jgi:autotransporter translocation and assembly factor TamB